LVDATLEGGILGNDKNLKKDEEGNQILQSIERDWPFCTTMYKIQQRSLPVLRCATHFTECHLATALGKREGLPPFYWIVCGKGSVVPLLTSFERRW